MSGRRNIRQPGRCSMLSPSPDSITISRRARAGSLTDHQQAENSEFARETAQRKRGSSCVALGFLKGTPQRRILTAISAKPHRGASFLIRTQYSSSALKLAPWVFLLTAADSVPTVVYRAGARIAAARHLATCICGRLLLLPLTRKSSDCPRQGKHLQFMIGSEIGELSDGQEEYAFRSYFLPKCSPNHRSRGSGRTRQLLEPRALSSERS